MFKILIYFFALAPAYLGWELVIDNKPTSVEFTILLFAGLFSYITIRTLIAWDNDMEELKNYRYLDFSRQSNWTPAKEESLRYGVEKGHELERLAEALGHTVASVRMKLVKTGRYEAYLEKYVEAGAKKFSEWQKVQRKIGKFQALSEISETDAENPPEPNHAKIDAKFVLKLLENWFDPRLEFCETFHLSATDQQPDPITQHEVIKHVSAFLNSAGGFVLIGAGQKGRILGLFEDDFRTPLHYKNRLADTLRKAIGIDALKYVDIKIIRIGSEDLCLITCKKSEELVLCCHRQYNSMDARSKEDRLHYTRSNAMSKVVEQQMHDQSDELPYHQ